MNDVDAVWIAALQPFARNVMMIFVQDAGGVDVKRKPQRIEIRWAGKSVTFDVREILAMVLGFLLAIALIICGDLETGKTLALALVFFGIGRSTNK